MSDAISRTWRASPVWRNARVSNQQTSHGRRHRRANPLRVSRRMRPLADCTILHPRPRPTSAAAMLCGTRRPPLPFRELLRTGAVARRAPLERPDKPGRTRLCNGSRDVRCRPRAGARLRRVALDPPRGLRRLLPRRSLASARMPGAARMRGSVRPWRITALSCGSPASAAGCRGFRSGRRTSWRRTGTSFGPSRCRDRP